MRPGGDPEGWRRAYFEASATRSDTRAVGPVGRFLLAFLPTFVALSTLADFLLEKIL